MKTVNHTALKAMWKEGVSTREIGRRLGCSAGYVSVYAKRHKLKPLRSVLPQPRHSTVVRSLSQAPAHLKMPAAIPNPAPCGPVHYLASGIDRRCHFPLWKHRTPIADRFYCGDPISAGNYCAAHYTTCFIVSQRRRAA